MSQFFKKSNNRQQKFLSSGDGRVLYEKFDEGEMVQHSEGESEFLATKEKHSKITTYASVHSYGKRINKEKED